MRFPSGSLAFSKSLLIVVVAQCRCRAIAITVYFVHFAGNERGCVRTNLCAIAKSKFPGVLSAKKIRARGVINIHPFSNHHQLTLLVMANSKPSLNLSHKSSSRKRKKNNAWFFGLTVIFSSSCLEDHPLVAAKRTTFSLVKPSSMVLSAESDDKDSGVVNKCSRCVNRCVCTCCL